MNKYGFLRVLNKNDVNIFWWIIRAHKSAGYYATNLKATGGHINAMLAFGAYHYQRAGKLKESWEADERVALLEEEEAAFASNIEVHAATTELTDGDA